MINVLLGEESKEENFFINGGDAKKKWTPGTIELDLCLKDWELIKNNI